MEWTPCKNIGRHCKPLYFYDGSFFCRYFRLYFAGDISREVSNGATAAEFQAALMGTKQDASSGEGGGAPVYASVSMSTDGSGAVAWRVTFLSHLEVRNITGTTLSLFRSHQRCCIITEQQWLLIFFNYLFGWRHTEGQAGSPVSSHVILQCCNHNILPLPCSAYSGCTRCWRCFSSTEDPWVVAELVTIAPQAVGSECAMSCGVRDTNMPVFIYWVVL